MVGDVTVARRPVLDSPADYAVFALIVAVVVAVPGVYVTGELAGIITHFAVPKASLGQAPKIIGALPHHWSDPKQAWPPSTRPDLPGPIGFGIATAMVLVAMCSLGFVAAKRAWRGRSYRGYASRQELSANLSEQAVLKRGPVVRPSLFGVKFTVVDVGVSLGVATPSSLPLWCSVENSVLILAAPRQGKTSQLIIPWVRSWPGPLLTASLRADVLENTAMLRRDIGPVLVMAPTGMVDWPHKVRWPLTSRCQDFGKAYQRADVMVQVGKSASTSDSTGAGFFGTTATTMLAAWLHAAAVSGMTTDDVVRWALDPRIEEPIRILADHPDADPRIASVLDGIYRSPSETRSNMFTTAQTAITPLLSKTARETFCPDPGEGIDLEAVLRERGTIYLMVAEKQATALAPLISAFVDEYVETAKSIADRSAKGRHDPTVGIILDEVANISPLPQLPSLMSYAGGSGIFLAVVGQNKAQLRAKWGADEAEMLWSAATVKIALGGLSGQDLEDFSNLAGSYRESLTTYQRGANGATMQTTLQDRKTIEPGAVRTLEEARRETLVVHATTRAVKVRLQRHYESPHAKEYQAASEWAGRVLRGEVGEQDIAA